MTDADDLPRHLRLLWGLPEVRRGPRPGQTIEGIGAAAVAIADGHGLAAVSMKAVAAALGTTQMSLYRYLDAKEDLYEVMLDVAYGDPDEVLGRDDATAGWRPRLSAWADALARTLLAHPWVVDVPLSPPPVTPRSMAWTDRGVAALEGTGLAAAQRLSCLLLVDGFVRQHTRLSVQLGVAPTSSSRGDGDGGDGGDVYARRVLLLTDPERWPHLVAAREALTDEGDFYAEELAFGLGVVLDGIAALIARTPSSSAG